MMLFIFGLATTSTPPLRAYGHASAPGEVFKVRARSWEDKELGKDALFITVMFLCKIFIVACRSMNEEQPAALQNLHKMIARFNR